jgi:fructose-1,6-bisphosphatase I
VRRTKDDKITDVGHIIIYLIFVHFHFKYRFMIINRQVLTLDEFTIQQYRNYPGATGELSSLLRDIGLAAKRVNVEVNKAGLVDILGDAGSINVQGEEVKKLDVYANNQFTGALKHGISCAGIASEELDDIIVFDDEVSNNSKYVCMYDPLDGSANIDVNVSIGTIFAVFRRLTEKDLHATLEIFYKRALTWWRQVMLSMGRVQCWCMQQDAV